MATFHQPTEDRRLLDAAERLHHAWNAALEAKDPDRGAALYAEDATLESPLVCYLLRSENGVIVGREGIRKFLHIVFQHQPQERRTHRNPVFTDGRMLIWEYPRETPQGEQMDFTEVMEIADGLIRRHRVYWGWYGVRTLTTGSHSR